MTKVEQLADAIREMRPSELMTDKLNRRLQALFDDGVAEGRSTQAILEVQGRERFLKELRSKQAPQPSPTP